MLKRKSVQLDPRLPWLKDVRCVLSPMAGVTDRIFRDICRDHGADLAFCEFTSAAGLRYESEATWALVDTEAESGPVGIQIFGADPSDMADAARLVQRAQHDVLDLNFGCPAKKVVRKCGGSALLADVPLLEKIVRAVVVESTAPVSAKIRSGWDDASVNYNEVGLLLQEAGVVWVSLHSRTRAQKFTGHSDWDHIARLVAQLDIPVFGNGDVVDRRTCAEMIEQTACYAVMVGRGAIGNPWLFEQMSAAWNQTAARTPTFDEMCDQTIDHIRLTVERRGEKTGCLVVRKHIAKCFRNYPGAATLRKLLFATTNSADMIAVLKQAAAAGDPRLPVEEP